MMNKAPIFILTLMALSSGQAQDRAKPLSDSALTKAIDSFAVGDPLSKQPLSIGDDTPLFPEKKAEPAVEDKAEKKSKGPTVITSNNATFDNRIHTAIFIGDVVVVDPEFNVKCDKLTAYLKHNDKPADPAAAVPSAKPGPKPPNNNSTRPPATPAPAAAGKTDKENKGGALEKAVATMNGDGRVLITQDKENANGTITRSIGTAKKAVYDAATGDITLTGMPIVQQGFNKEIAIKEDTVMILNRVGVMRAIGPSRSEITGSEPDSKEPPKARKSGLKESATPGIINR